MHARGRAAPRRRARAPHPRSRSRRPTAGSPRAGPAAALMAGALGWSPERARARGRTRGAARVAARRAAEAERDDERALAAYRAALAERATPRCAVTELVLGLDQGTSSTRCVVLDARPARARRRVGRRRLVVPRPRAGRAGPGGDRRVGGARDRRRAGRRGRRAGRRGGARHREPDGDVRGLGSRDGRAIHPAIVWQDRRTDGACADAAAPATSRSCASAPGSSSTRRSRRPSCAWVLDHVDGAEPRRGVGSPTATSPRWLLHRLAGVHVTDAGNAGRSLLCPLGGLDWDDELLELFGIPRRAAAADRRLGRDRRRRSPASPCAPRRATSRRRCSACAAGRREPRR